MQVEQAQHELTSMARKWLAAFNDKQLEALLALYDDNAVHVSPKLRAKRPETEGKVAGKAALTSWFEDALTNLPTLQYEEQRITVQGNVEQDGVQGRIFMEYIRHNQGDADMEIAELLNVHHGKIVASKVYHG
eukprot:GILJ01004879.1.p2 GENE.GILJ01004879.1~~GILJ01004879.1.p2  ORF type:complete len:133 (-),score=22.93 GILJ01004879.1:236-634(-)